MSRNFYVASILASGPTNHSKEVMSEQLAEWKTLGHIQYFSPSILTLYRILSGDPSILPYFTWKRALGMIIQYFSDRECQISEVNGIFKAYCKVPTDHNDTCYFMINLYSKAESEALPLVEDYLVPYSIQEEQSFGLVWLLSTSIKHIFYESELFKDVFFSQETRISIEEVLASFESATVLFASELEMGGHWEWAVYMLTSIQNNESLVKGVLLRNAKIETLQKNDFVVDVLGVNKSWLHEAISLNLEYNFQFEDAIVHSFKAGHYLKVHELFMREVAPTCIISYPGPKLYEVLYLQYIQPLEPHKIEIASWALAEEVYMMYLDIKSKIEQKSEVTPDMCMSCLLYTSPSPRDS